MSPELIPSCLSLTRCQRLSGSECFEIRFIGFWILISALRGISPDQYGNDKCSESVHKDTTLSCCCSTSLYSLFFILKLLSVTFPAATCALVVGTEARRSILCFIRRHISVGSVKLYILGSLPNSLLTCCISRIIHTVLEVFLDPCS